MNKLKKDWKNRNYWTAAVLAVVVAAWVSIPLFAGSAQNMSGLELNAFLRSPTGAANPYGDAEFKLDSDGDRELRVKIEGISGLQSGTSLAIRVNGNVVGQAIVDDDKAELRLRTDHGQTVPVVNNGSTIDARNGATVLVNGVFGSGTPSPSGSGTASPSPSQSGTGTATPSPSQSGTASPSPSQSGTGTSTPSPSPSQSGTGTSTPSPSPSGTPVLVRTAILRSPTGSINPHGEAVWQLDANGNREIEVEVEDLNNLPIGTVLNAFVDGANIGTLTVDNQQKAKLKLRTQLGETVPVVNDGSPVEVLNGVKVLVNGVFGGGGPTPTGTGTSTPSPSPSQSGTGTATPSPSQSGTSTPSPSPSQSGTGTATPSPSQSGTSTPSPSPSQSGTGTATPSPSQSGTASPSPSPSGTPLVRTAVLRSPTGSVNPHGEATWEHQQYYQSSFQRELEVEVEDLNNIAQGTVLTAFVDGNLVGTMVVDDRQKAKLKLRSEAGQTVPDVNDGSTVEVRNGETVLVNGVFGGGPTPTGTGTSTPSPSPSQSGTGTATPSPSPSQSGTGTATPSPSPSQSGTASPSPSQSGTASPSPSQSGTASPSPSQSGTASPSPSQSETASPSPSPSQSETATPSPSPSQSGTASPSPSPSPNGANLFAGLTGSTLNGVVPGGFAELEIHSSRTELEIRVRQINLQIGTTLIVAIDGSAVGSMTVESGGEGRLSLRSDEGSVPVIIVGTAIQIRNGATPILVGTFTAFTGPTPASTGTPSPTRAGRSFEAHLTGARTSANGEIKVTISQDQTQATVFGEFHNLSSSQTGAYIESTVGTATTIRDLGVVGALNGNFAPVTFAVSAAEVQQLRAGLWSAVISSVNNPGGEIRGQLRYRSSHSDFDGDGSHDFSVYRPSTGRWYSQNSEGFGSQTFGSANDRVVSGDYDGDGLTDAAVYRNLHGQGVWEVKRSSDGGVTSGAWGLPTDIPVRGDFDGDGRLDLTVYRPSDGNWYIQKSNNTGAIAMHFGVSGDKPVPADIDGDGRDDLVVFRPSEGNWYWQRSSDGTYAATHFGVSEDIPVRGDFDGDGKADVTVYRPSTGTWYTLRSSDGGFQAAQFGLSEDVPVAGNYDADGRTDIAVFRPSDGNWYVLRSSDGQFEAFHFGVSGDIPAIAR